MEMKWMKKICLERREMLRSTQMMIVAVNYGYSRWWRWNEWRKYAWGGGRVLRSTQMMAVTVTVQKKVLRRCMNPAAWGRGHGREQQWRSACGHDRGWGEQRQGTHEEQVCSNILLYVSHASVGFYSKISCNPNIFEKVLGVKRLKELNNGGHFYSAVSHQQRWVHGPHFTRFF